MGSKTLLFFCISVAVVLMITSEVAATSVDNSKTVETNEEEEAKYHGGGYGGHHGVGHGGHPGGGYGGHLGGGYGDGSRGSSGGGRHGGYGHGGDHGGHPGEAADAEPQN